MVNQTLKILQHLLQDFELVFDHFVNIEYYRVEQYPTWKISFTSSKYP